MQENENPPTIGKSNNRKREEEFFASITEFRGARPLKVTIGDGIKKTLIAMPVQKTLDNFVTIVESNRHDVAIKQAESL